MKLNLNEVSLRHLCDVMHESSERGAIRMCKMDGTSTSTSLLDY